MIKLIKSTFYNEAETKKKLAEFILKADILSMSKECSKLEESFAKKQERKYAIFVSSGSAANLVLIQAFLNLGLLKKGDNIGFSALTWATNVMPLIQLGLNPIALDSEQKTLNVSPEILKKNLNNLQGLFLTNTLGFCDKIKEIQNICQKHSILLFEDNCESLGSKAYGKLLGNFGIASTFSFFVGHHLSTIEGGMICTDNQELYNMCKMVRAHGWDRNLKEKEQRELRKKHIVDDFYSRYTFYDLAFNTRPSEINGFLGNEQIKFWDKIVKKREENFFGFLKIIEENPDMITLDLKHMDLISNFAMPLIFKDEATCKKYKSKFIESKIEIRPIIAGDITQQPFYKKYIKQKQNCLNSDFIHKNGFYFGNNPDLNNQEIDKLSKLLKK